MDQAQTDIATSEASKLLNRSSEEGSVLRTMADMFKLQASESLPILGFNLVKNVEGSLKFTIALKNDQVSGILAKGDELESPLVRNSKKMEATFMGDLARKFDASKFCKNMELPSDGSLLDIPIQNSQIELGLESEGSEKKFSINDSPLELRGSGKQIPA